MKKRISIFIIIITCLVLLGYTFTLLSSHPVPNDKDVIGIWKSSDGAAISLSADHKCKIVNLPSYLLDRTINPTSTKKDTVTASDCHWVLAKKPENLEGYSQVILMFDHHVANTQSLGLLFDAKDLGDPGRGANVLYWFYSDAFSHDYVFGKTR